MVDERERLPRRDWLILPLLSVLSLVLLWGIGEISARVIWPENLADRCALPDPAVGFRFRPNCESRIRSFESSWENTFYNACGFRTAEPCGPKPDNGFRVAVIGSSISNGYLVPYEQTFAARATAVLQERCRVPVDFQNLGVPAAAAEKALLHIDTALALKPNVVLMVVATHELQMLSDERATAAPSKAPAPRSLGATVRDFAAQVRSDRAVEVALHFIYQNLNVYLPLFLQHGDEADFLRQPLSAPWRRRLSQFDGEIAQISARVRAGGASFMLVFVPLRAQALLVRWDHRPPDVDPTLIGREIGDIARRDGAAYVDLTETIGARADVGRLYYPFDRHPNGAANAVIGRAVVNAILESPEAPPSCRHQIEAAQ